MAEQFYTILTKIGKAKIANTSALGSKLNLAKFQVGDSNGSYYNPTEEQTELKHKVWEGNISSITIDENNPNWIVLQTMLPGDIGGFMIREAGVFDNEGNLIAVGKYPETYKPVTSEGSSKDLVIKMILEVSNATSVTLKVDPTVILATKKDIEILENKIKNIKVPVTSVNKKTGDIELKAEDIKCNDGKTIESSLNDKASNKELTDGLNTKVNNTDYSKLNLYVGTTTGTSTAYIGTVANNQKSYVDGQVITFVPHIDCGNSPTFNLNGIGAVNLVNQDGNLKAAELKANKPYSFVRVGNNFFIRSSGNNIKLPKWVNSIGNTPLRVLCKELPTGRGHIQTACVQDYIYAISGMLEGKNWGVLTKEVHRYDYLKDSWKTCSPIPTPIYSDCGIAVINNQFIYMVSGDSRRGGAEKERIVQFYDHAIDTWTILNTDIRLSCNATALGTDLYVLGRREYYKKIEFLKFDTITKTFQVMIGESDALPNGKMFTYNDEIYCIDKKIYKYDKRINSWSIYADVDISVMYCNVVGDELECCDYYRNVYSLNLKTKINNPYLMNLTNDDSSMEYYSISKTGGFYYIFGGIKSINGRSGQDSIYDMTVSNRMVCYVK